MPDPEVVRFVVWHPAANWAKIAVSETKAWEQCANRHNQYVVVGETAGFQTTEKLKYAGWICSEVRHAQ